MTASMKRILRAPWFAPVFLSLLALAVRLFRIGVESIWLDEATSLFLARKSVPEVIAWTARDIHPPLYYLLLHFWRAFGESEMALRSLSAVAGALSVGVMYGLANRLFDRRTALIAGALLLVAPLHVWYSQQARMYSLLGLWILAASYLLVVALQERKWGYWVGFAAANALALYTHYYALFGFAAQAAFTLYWSWRSSRWRDLLPVAGAMVGSVLLFAPWLPTMAFQVRTGGGGWVAQSGVPGVRAFADVAIGFIVGNVRTLYPAWMRWAAYALFGGLIGVALLQAARWFARRERKAEVGVVFGLIYVAVPVALAWMISQVKPLFSERYLQAFLPGFVLLAARGIALLKPRCIGWAVGGVATALLAFGVWQMGVYPQNPDWRGVAARVAPQVQPGDVAVFYPGWEEKPFGYYYVSDQLDVYSWFKVPLPPDEVAASVEPGLTGHKRAWLIWTIGHYGDPEGMIKQYMDGRFGASDIEQFRGPIGVALYTLSPN